MVQYIKFALLVLVAGITGCGSLPMERKVKVRTTQVTWLDETPETCGDARGHINACATNASDYSWCVMRMPENTVDWIVAEETKHCFGEVHPK